MRWLVVAFLLASCSPTPTAAPRPAPTLQSPPAPQRYEEAEPIVQELKAVLPIGELILEDTGGHPELLDFEEWNLTSEGIVDIYVFESREARETWLAQMIQSTTVVYAKNWVVITFGFEEEVRSALGGTIAP